MSAIAGVCYWDGRPVPEADLAVIAEHSRAAGPDGGGTCVPVPGVALEAHVLAFDRLSATERQPYVFGRGSVLTWDGRLDNREDLLLRLHHDLGSDITDAALVAAAYARWGLDCLPRLIGDWSLAIWNGASRQVVLARDYMGNRPLHYVEVPGGLAWASSLDALADCFDLYRQPDEAYIAARLTFGVPPDMTPFRGIRALRAGHMLVASEVSGITVRRYWTFEPARIRYGSPDEYTDHMRELLTEAVQVRLRANQHVWSHLSGGFDTSAIVCIAHALIQRGQVDAQAIRPLSMVVSDSPESDESSFIEAVERWCGIASVRREWTDARPTFSELLGHRRPDHAFVEHGLESAVNGTHDRTVLSGDLGDLVMIRGSGHAVSLFEPLHDGHPFSFLTLTFLRARHRRRPWLSSLVRLAWHTYLPPHVLHKRGHKQMYAELARRAGSAVSDLASAFGVTPALLARAPQRESPVYPSLAGFPIVKRPMLDAVYRLADHPALSNTDAVPRLWRTFAFSHRPLVEYMLATPQLAFWDPVLNRAGMRRALVGILPPEILERISKGDPTTASRRAALSWTPERARVSLPDTPTANWHIIKNGYIALDALEREVNTFTAGYTCPSGFLDHCIRLEAWLQTLAGLAGLTGSEDAQRTPTQLQSGPWRPARGQPISPFRSGHPHAGVRPS